MFCPAVIARSVVHPERSTIDGTSPSPRAYRFMVRAENDGPRARLDQHLLQQPAALALQHGFARHLAGDRVLAEFVQADQLEIEVGDLRRVFVRAYVSQHYSGRLRDLAQGL